MSWSPRVLIFASAREVIEQVAVGADEADAGRGWYAYAPGGSSSALTRP
jgi:hypothetical protein